MNNIVSYSILMLLCHTNFSMEYFPGEDHRLHATMTLKIFPARSSSSSIFGQARKARSRPLPRPRYGRSFVAKDAKMGLRILELPASVYLF